MKIEFLNSLSKNTQLAIVMKLSPMEAELFHADRRTDMTQLIVAFRNFVNAGHGSITGIKNYLISCPITQFLVMQYLKFSIVIKKFQDTQIL
jgi:hypothetical protein